jgi:cell cycle arrest protein BUB2
MSTIEHLNALCEGFLQTCKDDTAGEAAVQQALDALRKGMLVHCLCDSAGSDTSQGGRMTARGRVWKVLLGVDRIDAEEYLTLIKRKESDKYRKIRSDSFRTFPNDEEFQERVSEDEIVRVLNSFVLRSAPKDKITYCQGLNTICAPFLYAMPEADAFFTFSKFVCEKFPLYWVSSHIGVQAGCMLVDACLEIVDPALFARLKSKNLEAYLYAFSCTSSLSASVPPFVELMKLWDFLVAFGPQFNIFCVVAQIIAMREQLLASDNPKALLDYRKWPRLNARRTISIAMALLPQLRTPGNGELYRRICHHATDPVVASEITGRETHDTIMK